jgi:hypothetical protein
VSYLTFVQVFLWLGVFSSVFMGLCFWLVYSLWGNHYDLSEMSDRIHTLNFFAVLPLIIWIIRRDEVSSHDLALSTTFHKVQKTRSFHQAQEVTSFIIAIICFYRRSKKPSVLCARAFIMAAFFSGGAYYLTNTVLPNLSKEISAILHVLLKICVYELLILLIKV